MFEWRIAFRYLIPRKKNLSTALISLLSVFVISLVVWLVLIFLSVTTGIEKNWLNKLTSLNAPIQILPTDRYFSSYYHQVDSLSSASNFEIKTIGEKAKALKTDPYDPEVDQQIPKYWLDSDKRSDPVKSLYSSLQHLKEKHPDLIFQDFELTGALTRIFLNETSQKLETSFLTQMTYLLSFNDKNPHMSSLMLPPSAEDIQNLIRRIPRSDSTKIQEIFSNVTIQKIKTLPSFALPASLLPEDIPFSVESLQQETQVLLDPNREKKSLSHAILTRKKNKLVYSKDAETKIFNAADVQIFLTLPLIFDCQIQAESLKNAKKISDIQFKVRSFLQKTPIEGDLFFQKLKVVQAEAKTRFEKRPAFNPPWPFLVWEKDQKAFVWKLPEKSEEAPIILPKQYKQHQIKIGDRGYFSYNSMSTTSSVEQRLYFTIAGFYDPGILPIGNRFIFVPEFVSRTIISPTLLGKSDSCLNGLFVWFDDLSQIAKLRLEILNELKEKQIHPFWKLLTFHEYEFSKDLMQQFQSDRLLFTLIAFIILIVACSSVISMLVLLVNDKKKEIAILQAMGAKTRNIAIIFGLCGMITGLISSLIGIIAAVFTLQHLDFILSFLSKIQGHAMFNTAFFGTSLPNQLSVEAATFIFIMTPVLSIVAGLIPAIKASRLKPSEILRGE